MRPADRTAAAWVRAVDAVGRHLGTRLASGPAPDIVWWGGADSGLLSVARLPEDARCLLVDEDPRRIRTASRAAGRPLQTRRLLSLADLGHDGDRTEQALAAAPPRSLDAYLALQERLAADAREQPAVADGGCTHLVMDLVLNRLATPHWAAALDEAMRVLGREGSVMCVVLLADEPVDGSHALRPLASANRFRLPTELEVVQALESAGFHGMSMQWGTALDPEAVDRIGEADVRLCLVEAWRGKQGPCLELGQAVVYRGPWREVRDDDGHVYPRGERVAVCAKTFGLLMRAPYAADFIGLRSVAEPTLDQALPFDCTQGMRRDPKVTKGLRPFVGSRTPDDACTAGSGCC